MKSPLADRSSASPNVKERQNITNVIVCDSFQALPWGTPNREGLQCM